MKLIECRGKLKHVAYVSLGLKLMLSLLFAKRVTVTVLNQD
jgi:hypothetical protein